MLDKPLIVLRQLEYLTRLTRASLRRPGAGVHVSQPSLSLRSWSGRELGVPWFGAAGASGHHSEGQRVPRLGGGVLVTSRARQNPACAAGSRAHCGGRHPDRAAPTTLITTRFVSVIPACARAALVTSREIADGLSTVELDAGSRTSTTSRSPIPDQGALARALPALRPPAGRPRRRHDLLGRGFRAATLRLTTDMQHRVSSTPPSLRRMTPDPVVETNPGHSDRPSRATD